MTSSCGLLPEEIFGPFLYDRDHLCVAECPFGRIQGHLEVFESEYITIVQNGWQTGVSRYLGSTPKDYYLLTIIKQHIGSEGMINGAHLPRFSAAITGRGFEYVAYDDGCEYVDVRIDPSFFYQFDIAPDIQNRIDDDGVALVWARDDAWVLELLQAILNAAGSDVAQIANKINLAVAYFMTHALCDSHEFAPTQDTVLITGAMKAMHASRGQVLDVPSLLRTDGGQPS